MKQPLNKQFHRMQKLAGIITENKVKLDEYGLEHDPNLMSDTDNDGDIDVNDAYDLSTAVSQVSKIINKAENDPSIDKLAKDIASNPKEAQELINTLKKLGVNPTSLNENTEDAAKKLALMFAKTAEEKLKDQISESNEDITGRVMTGLASAFGGAVAAPWLAEKLGMFVTKYTDSFLRIHTNPEWWVPLAGAAAGILLTIIGAKVYDLMSGESQLKESKAPIYNVTTMDSKTVVGTHQYGIGFKANEVGKKMGFKDHPTSIPNKTKIDRTDNIEQSVNEALRKYRKNN